MDRVMLSYNVPNFITVNLMAWLGLIVFLMIYQAVAKRGRKSGGIASPGSDEIEFTGGY